MAPRGGRKAGSGDSDFVVVANRLPIDMERLPDGTTTWKRSPGGLVTALVPLLRRRRGAWVGWPGIPDAGDAHAARVQRRERRRMRKAGCIRPT